MSDKLKFSFLKTFNQTTSFGYIHTTRFGHKQEVGNDLHITIFGHIQKVLYKSYGCIKPDLVV